jgi:uncharacterized protein (DUF2062 family)
MWYAVTRLEMHKTGSWFVPFLLLIVGYVLIVPSPLGGTDLGLVALGAILGKVLGGKLFQDAPDVAAYVYSWPLSRRRLFLYRWVLGIGCHAIVGAAVAFVITSGARELVQVKLAQSVWYPMIRPYEIGAVWPVLLTSLLFYQATCFIVLKEQLSGRSRRQSRTGRRQVSLWFFLTITILILIVLYSSVAQSQSGPGPVDAEGIDILFGYLALLTVATTLGAMHCCRFVEIDA